MNSSESPGIWISIIIAVPSPPFPSMHRLVIQLLQVLTCAAVCMLATSARGMTVGSDEFIAAAHEDHLWFVTESNTGSKSVYLCHSALDMKGAHFQVQATLTHPPVMMAAWRQQVWMVFASRNGSASSRREVFTLQVEPDPTLGGYVSVPRDRLEVAAALPDGGRLASIVAGVNGPIALLIAGAGQEGTRLLHLPATGSSQWVEMALPEDFPTVNSAFLAMRGTQGDEVSIFAADTNSANRTLRFDRIPDGTWTQSELSLNLDAVRSMTHAAGQALALALDVTAANASPTYELLYLRPSKAIHLASFSRPDSRWTVVGMRDGVHILERKSDGRLMQRRVDLLEGTVSEPVLMTVQPISSARIWQMVVLLGAIASGLLLVFLVRPTPKEAIKLPKGVAILPIGQRFFALAIDLAPAGFVTMLALKVRIGELMAMPLITVNFEQSMPYLMMVTATVVHTMLTELLTSRSLGKMVVEGRIARLDGSKPSASQILLRSVLKFVVLLLPPLAILAVLNQHSQSVGDMAASTLVVHEPDETEAP